MITLEAWRQHRDQWLDEDLRLMTTQDGWRKRTQKNDVTIWQRSFPDDNNDLFRWRLPRVAASHREVFQVFTQQMIDYHQYWTAEYTGGCMVAMVEEDARIYYQQFDANIPLISKRDLLYIQWSRVIDERTIQTSFRSIVMDGEPVPAGYERIGWWGAHLFEANPDGTSQLVLIDRENQGGRFPSFLMNATMPKFLTHQFEHIVTFFDKGGPAAHAKLSGSQNSALRTRTELFT